MSSGFLTRPRAPRHLFNASFSVETMARLDALAMALGTPRVRVIERALNELAGRLEGDEFARFNAARAAGGGAL